MDRNNLFFYNQQIQTLKRAIIFLTAILVYAITFGQGQTHVQGYYRSNGTYVQGHYRTLPNSTVLDNWSMKGNINPYTGKEGTKYPSNSSYQKYSPSNMYPSSSNYISATYDTYSKNTRHHTSKFKEFLSDFWYETKGWHGVIIATPIVIIANIVQNHK